MAVRCEYIEPPKDPEKLTKILVEEVIPIFREYWEKHGNGSEFAFDKEFGSEQNQYILSFIRMWAFGGLLLSVAREENGEIVGFLLAGTVIPIMYHGRVMQVAAYYGRTIAIERVLFEFFDSVIGVLSPDEVIIQEMSGQHIGPLKGKMERLTYQRYMRE